MVPCSRAAAMALLLSSLGAPVLAQSKATAQRPDPADPAAAVPPLVYRSAIAKAAPPAEAAVGSWPEANERVWRIGGWRAYAREASQAPASAASAAPAGPFGTPRQTPK